MLKRAPLHYPLLLTALLCAACAGAARAAASLPAVPTEIAQLPAASTSVPPAYAPTIQPAPSPVVIQSPPVSNASLFTNAIQAKLQSTAQTAQAAGVTLRVSDFYLFANHLFVSVCFAAPGPESRTIGPATLTFANGALDGFEVRTTLDQMTTGANPLNTHCDTLEFLNFAVGAQLSQLGLSVQSVLFSATAPEGQGCPLTQQRQANSTMLKQLGLTVRCAAAPGFDGWEVATKPAGMSDDEAQTLAGRELAGMIIGPWVFENVPLTAD